MRGFIFSFVMGAAAYAAMPAQAANIDGHCAALGPKLPKPSELLQGKLFVSLRDGWQEVPRLDNGWFHNYYSLGIVNYYSQILKFIYVPAPVDYGPLQFLAVKTTSQTGQDQHFVTLRKHHTTFPRSVYYEVYQQYHLTGADNSDDLRFYHHWDWQNRSDVPDTTRQSFAFGTNEPFENQPTPRHKLLTISYHTSAERITCVPFFLGPNLASFIAQESGDDQVTLELPFVIEVTEAKTAAGEAGGTFVLQSSGK